MNRPSFSPNFRGCALFQTVVLHVDIVVRKALGNVFPFQLGASFVLAIVVHGNRRFYSLFLPRIFHCSSERIETIPFFIHIAHILNWDTDSYYYLSLFDDKLCFHVNLSISQKGEKQRRENFSRRSC